LLASVVWVKTKPSNIAFQRLLPIRQKTKSFDGAAPLLKGVFAFHPVQLCRVIPSSTICLDALQ